MTTFEDSKRVADDLEGALLPLIDEFVETVGSYPTTFYVNANTLAYINSGIARINPYNREGYQQLTYATDKGYIEIMLSKKYPTKFGYSALSNNGDEEQLLKVACQNILLRD